MMTKEEFIYERARECKEKLLDCQKNTGDPEVAHVEADAAIMTFLKSIGFGDIVIEFEEVHRWYA